MKAMQRDVALALPIFPFEEALYQQAGVPVQFLGHPLVDRVPAPVPSRPPMKSISSAICAELRVAVP